MLIIYTGFSRLGAIRILIDNVYTHDAKIYYVQKYKREKGEKILARLKHTHVGKQSAYHMAQIRRFTTGSTGFRKWDWRLHDDVRTPVLVITGDTGRTSAKHVVQQ